jgi:hypothetical protein
MKSERSPSSSASLLPKGLLSPLEAERHEETGHQKHQSEEIRATINVKFEALSHIQTSIDASSEEERVQTYRKFKEALYECFKHADEDR